jgi:hypothetical protein
MLTVDQVALGVMALWVAFDVCRTVGGWLRKPPPVLTREDVAEAVMEALTAFDEAQVRDRPLSNLVQTVVQGNGHHELTEDDVLANLSPQTPVPQAAIGAEPPTKKKPKPKSKSA